MASAAAAAPPKAPLELELDHLVVATATLDAGVAHVAAALGLSPDAFSPVGKHALLGTHNRLLGLGPSCYLEVIAVDPEAPPPARRRWFGLDDPTMRSRLAAQPALVTWVARLRPPQDLGAAAAAQPGLVPPLVAMSRGEFRWRIAVPDDGSLPGGGSGVAGGGLIPTLLQWDVPRTPAQALPPTPGVSLRCLRGQHPQAARVRDSLAALGADGLISVEEATGEPRLVAEFDTPAGVRTLS